MQPTNGMNGRQDVFYQPSFDSTALNKIFPYPQPDFAFPAPNR
jgi:hypothetical protein